MSMDIKDREEQFLSAIAGETATSDLPEPVTRKEVYLKQIAESGGGGGGTTDYEALSNKPSINGVTLIGDKLTSDLGLADNDYVNDTVAYAISQAKEEMRAYTDSAIEAITDFESEVFPNA